MRRPLEDAMRRKTEDQPWISNYLPLDEWLKKYEARCDWQLPLGGSKDDPAAYIEQWGFPNGTSCIVTVYANKGGWNIATPNDESNAVDAAFLDAEDRCRLVRK
jgi:hypothetical protein